MSSKAQAWAWCQVLETGPKFILIALSDFADEEGTCFPSVATLCQLTGMSDRTVRTHIKSLEESGHVTILERRVRPDGMYSTNRYRLNLSDQRQDSPVAPTREDAPPPAKSAGQELLTTNYIDVSTTRYARSRNRVRKAPRADPDAALDPEKIVWEDVAPAPASTDVEIDHRPKTRSLSPAQNLARSFDLIARRHPDCGAQTVPTNKGALSGQFSAWMRNGTEAETIRQMIQTYWDEGFTRDMTRPPWQDFLNKRFLIQQKLGMIKQRDLVEENRHNAEWWSEI